MSVHDPKNKHTERDTYRHWKQVNGYHLCHVNCYVCGDLFTSKRSDATFCSAKCRMKQSRLDKKAALSSHAVLKEFWSAMDKLADLTPDSRAEVMRSMRDKFELTMSMFNQDDM